MGVTMSPSLLRLFLLSLGVCVATSSCQDPLKVHCTAQARTDEALPNACFGFVPSQDTTQSSPGLYLIMSQDRGIVRVVLEPLTDGLGGKISLVMQTRDEEIARQMGFTLTTPRPKGDGTVLYDVHFRGKPHDEMEIQEPIKTEIVAMMNALIKAYAYLEAHPDQQEGFPTEHTTPLFDLLTRQAWILYDEPSFR